jgi:hypothetical protein
LTQTTRRLRQNSVVIVDSDIPDGMTIPEYRRSRSRRESAAPRRRFRLGSKVRSSATAG